MAKIVRKANWYNKKRAIENDQVFYMEEIADVLELIATKQYPDGNFSDDECNLWSLICSKLKIHF